MGEGRRRNPPFRANPAAIILTEISALNLTRKDNPTSARWPKKSCWRDHRATDARIQQADNFSVPRLTDPKRACNVSRIIST
jgi:hypothetical protein